MSADSPRLSDIKKSSIDACESINDFSSKTLRAIGGRMGSGMGMLLEALWGYYMNKQISEEKGTKYEIGWIPSHEYNDFACVTRDADWNPTNREGELFRIEAKSMNIEADESKGHFDALVSELRETDLLLVIVWKWEEIDSRHISPKIVDHFIGPALVIAKLRDALHVARGGSFVSKNSCPDKDAPDSCKHEGEPLNASGKRERLTGPESRRPSSKVSYAANFGGLLRMLKTEKPGSEEVFRRIRKEDDVANEFISFIHRNFPVQEEPHYSAKEWSVIAQQAGLGTSGLKKQQVAELVRKRVPD